MKESEQERLLWLIEQVETKNTTVLQAIRLESAYQRLLSQLGFNTIPPNYVIDHFAGGAKYSWKVKQHIFSLYVDDDLTDGAAFNHDDGWACTRHGYFIEDGQNLCPEVIELFRTHLKDNDEQGQELQPNGKSTSDSYCYNGSY